MEGAVELVPPAKHYHVILQNNVPRHHHCNHPALESQCLLQAPALDSRYDESSKHWAHRNLRRLIWKQQHMAKRLPFDEIF